MNFTQFTTKVKFWAKKNAPTILAVGGFSLCTVGAVVACKATIKANRKKEEAKLNLEIIEECKNNGVTGEGEEYTPEDYKKDKAIVKGGLIREYLKDYALPVSLYAAGGACIFAGNHLNNKRLQASYAAYAGLAAAYARYRGAVKAALGEEKEGELYGGKLQETGCTVTDLSTGEVTEISDLQLDKDAAGYSPLAYKYEGGNINWSPSNTRNRDFLDRRQQWANDEYQRRGKLTYNEVMRKGLDVPDDYLPIEGQFFGWDKSLPGCPKEIKFNHDCMTTPASRAFMNGDINYAVIDPNCVNIYYTYPKVTK